MRKLLSFVASLCVLAIGFPALADWNVGDPYKMHYPQLPDINATVRSGIDVVDSQQVGYGAQWKILADDWMCTESGPVNDIHLWGSWFAQPSGPAAPDPNAVFKLSIHSNIAGTPSHPGPELWSTTALPGQYTQRLWAGGYLGHFWDPNPNAPPPNGILGNDSDVWQYNFTDLVGPFVQQQGTIYWLDVQVLSPQAEYFGWRSTDPSVTAHFMDDAVYSDTNGFDGPLLVGWTPLTYPGGAYFQGSMDLAFVITPEPATVGLLGLAGIVLLARRPRRH